MPKKSTQKRIAERGKIAVNFEVEPDIHEHLRVIANQEDRSISAILRRIIVRDFAERGIIIKKKT